MMAHQVLQVSQEQREMMDQWVPKDHQALLDLEAQLALKVTKGQLAFLGHLVHPERPEKREMQGQPADRVKHKALDK